MPSHWGYLFLVLVLLAFAYMLYATGSPWAATYSVFCAGFICKSWVTRVPFLNDNDE